MYPNLVFIEKFSTSSTPVEKENKDMSTSKPTHIHIFTTTVLPVRVLKCICLHSDVLHLQHLLLVRGVYEHNVYGPMLLRMSRRSNADFHRSRLRMLVNMGLAFQYPPKHQHQAVTVSFERVKRRKTNLELDGVITYNKCNVIVV